jgi:hypothetical protein
MYLDHQYSTNNNNENTNLFYGTEEANKAALDFNSNADTAIDACIDSTEGDKEESNEPDYDEDKDQLEEEQEEEEAGEMTMAATTNHVF